MKKVLVVIFVAAAVSLGADAAGAQTMDDTMADMDNNSAASETGTAGMEGTDHSVMPVMNDNSEQESSKDGDTSNETDTMPGMDHGAMTHENMTHENMTHENMTHENMTHENMTHENMTHENMDHQTMDHGAMDHGNMDHGNMNHESMNHQSMNHTAAAMSGDMAGMSHGSMQGGSAPPDARDPHAYSDGFDFGPIPKPRLGDEHNFGSLLMDRLEAVHTSDNNSAAYALQGWYGRDYDRALLKAEGEVDDGKLHEARTQLFWSHAVTAYWNTLLGVRYDSGEDPGRGWAGFGIQGLAPYWFEVDAAGFVGEKGRFALNLEAEYELLITQRLILQPRLETDLYSKKDSERGIGSGLSAITAGIRLRYEVRRQFAPYVGVEWSGLFGGTADYARDAGVDTRETRAVAGVRAWF